MTKVYLVWRLGYEGDDLEGVYSTEKKAEDITLALNSHCEEQSYAFTEEDVQE